METFTIRLTEMNMGLAKDLFKGFQRDPDLFLDPSHMKPYKYDQSAVEAYVERQKALGRIHFAIMFNQKPIGEILLKDIEPRKSCTLSIHLKDNSVKNKGYGTEAEYLAINYAFQKLEMESVYADALRKNTRSRHVLEKIGFKEIRSNEDFAYYELRKTQWMGDIVRR